MNKTIAICPGSFDPITKGHLDIISRSAKMFDKVIVVVMSNVYKTNSTFTIEQRIDMIKKGLVEPKGCGCCPSCRKGKMVTGVVSYKKLFDKKEPVKYE